VRQPRVKPCRLTPTAVDDLNIDRSSVLLAKRIPVAAVRLGELMESLTARLIREGESRFRTQNLAALLLADKTRFRGPDRVGWMFTFAAAAYNLVRMRNLMAQAACGRPGGTPAAGPATPCEPPPQPSSDQFNPG